MILCCLYCAEQQEVSLVGSPEATPARSHCKVGSLLALYLYPACITFTLHHICINIVTIEYNILESHMTKVICVH